MMVRGWRPVSRSSEVLVVALLVAAAAAPALGAERTFEIAAERLDCRYSTASPTQASAEETPSPVESVLLPDNDVFRPLLADQREPRFYADYRQVWFQGGSDVLAEGQGPHIDAALF
jgi:hypothetical protein